MQNLQRKLFAVFVVSMVFLAAMQFSAIMPVSAQNQGKALILSSLEKYVPMGYSETVKKYLTKAGRNVTFVRDAAVTLDLLTTELNNYDVIIWRTNAYDWAHTTYWYVGELSNRATLSAYASDFEAGWIDNTNGILGVSVEFFLNHFDSGSLSNVKLIVLVSSLSSSIATVLLGAGAKSAIAYVESFSLYFGMIDFATALVFGYLTNGLTVENSVEITITRFRNVRVADPLDSKYVPPISSLGDGTLAIV